MIVSIAGGKRFDILFKKAGLPVFRLLGSLTCRICTSIPGHAGLSRSLYASAVKKGKIKD